MHGSNLDIQQRPQQGRNNNRQDNVSHANQEQTSSRGLKTQDQNSEELTCQLPLQDTLRPDLCIKDQENPRDVITVHGPSTQGPRLALMISTSSKVLSQLDQ